MSDRIFRYVFIIIALFFSQSALAQNCPAQMPPGNLNRAIDARPINQSLFSELVLYHTNVERCRRNLPPVQLARGPITAATTAATVMASTRTYSHNLNRRGAQNLSERLHSAGARFRTGGENIAKNFFYVLNGRPYIGGGCNFRYQANGQPVPRHSYASLAAETFNSWMQSAGHRENILNRRYRNMGAALGLDAQGQLCGEIYISQVFTG